MKICRRCNNEVGNPLMICLHCGVRADTGEKNIPFIKTRYIPTFQTEKGTIPTHRIVQITYSGLSGSLTMYFISHRLDKIGPDYEYYLLRPVHKNGKPEKYLFIESVEPLNANNKSFKNHQIIDESGRKMFRNVFNIHFLDKHPWFPSYREYLNTYGKLMNSIHTKNLAGDFKRVYKDLFEKTDEEMKTEVLGDFFLPKNWDDSL
jgi:hypothetical protein